MLQKNRQLGEKIDCIKLSNKTNNKHKLGVNKHRYIHRFEL